MASKTIVTIVCDMCGKEAEHPSVDVKTHSVTLDGRTMEIDLCGKDWEKALRGFARFGEVGRVIKKGKNERHVQRAS